MAGRLLIERTSDLSPLSAMSLFTTSLALFLFLFLATTTTTAYISPTLVRSPLRTSPGLISPPDTALFAMSRRSLLSTGAVVVASTAVLTTPQPSLAASAIPTGKAPAFELPNSKGEGATSLQQLLATKKWTVLYFYPGAFTSGCTLEVILGASRVATSTY